MDTTIKLNLYDYTPVELALKKQGGIRKQLMAFYGFKDFPATLPNDHSAYLPPESDDDEDDEDDEPAADSATASDANYSKQELALTPEDKQNLKNLRTMISAFCKDINQLMAEATPIAIYQINGKPNEKKPVLFRNWGAIWSVTNFAGVLRFKLIRTDSTGKKISCSVQIQVHSRFDMENDKGHFLMYMFEKGAAAHGSVYPDMTLIGKQINSWDLMMTVTFVENLHKAMKKGLFKQYRDYERNDSRLRGRVDVARHIRENPIFTGRVAYVAREHTTDNLMNVLILRTYHHLERKYPSLLYHLVTKNDIVRKGIMTLQAEVENWQSGSDYELIQKTSKKIVHSVYQEYETLRQTCHAVLTKMGVNLFDSTNIQNDSEKGYVSGILINLPKLWEEFLYYAVIRDFAGLSGPYQQLDSMNLVGSPRQARPDFLIPSKGKKPYSMVLDAKYKKSWGDTMGTPAVAKVAWKKVRNDLFQILAYQLAYDCKSSGAIFPISKAAAAKQDTLTVYPVSRICQDRFFARIPYIVPAITADNDDYREEFLASDKQLRNNLEILFKTKKADLSQEGTPSGSLSDEDSEDKD